MKRTACLALAGLALSLSAWAADPMGGHDMNAPASDAMMDKSPMSEADKISNAMSAAPSAIGNKATVMDWPSKPGQKGKILRPGSNGWTCLPDYPGTPGNDPMCLDKQWMSFMGAYMQHKKPVVTGVGVAYMLQGGSDASATDPFAEKPAAGQDWMQDPPHIMVISPRKWDRMMFSEDMHAGGAWIMWGNTPYEHLMVPVQ